MGSYPGREFPLEMIIWLAEKRDALGGGAALAEKVGVAESTMNGYLNGVRTRTSKRIFRKFVRAFPELARQPWFDWRYLVAPFPVPRVAQSTRSGRR